MYMWMHTQKKPDFVQMSLLTVAVVREWNFRRDGQTVRDQDSAVSQTFVGNQQTGSPWLSSVRRREEVTGAKSVSQGVAGWQGISRSFFKTLSSPIARCDSAGNKMSFMAKIEKTQQHTVQQSQQSKEEYEGGKERTCNFIQ